MAWLIPALQVKNDGAEENRLLTFVSWFKETFPPFYISLPPHAIPVANRRGGFDQQITADVVSIRNNHMVFRGVLKT